MGLIERFFHKGNGFLPVLLFLMIWSFWKISNKRQSKVAQGKKMKISEAMRAILD